MQTPRKEKQALIGDLLVRAELISRHDLTNALTIARQMSLPIGHILTVNGFVTDEELNAALRVQALVRDKLLAEQQGIDALTVVREQKKSIEDALDEQNWRSEYLTFTKNLGQLLIDANAVTPDKLKSALAACHSSGLPLGRVLVLQGAISEFVAYAALTAQALLRDKKIARDQAVGSLRLTSMHGDTIEDYLEFGGLRKIRPDHVLRLGEMFVLSGLVSELDLLSAVETGLMEAQPIGHILVQHNLIRQEAIDAALRLQDLIREQKIEPLKAVDVLKEYASHQDGSGNFEQIVERIAKKKIKPPTSGLAQNDARLLETVHGLGFVSETELAEICKEVIGGNVSVVDYLTRCTRVDDSKIKTAMRCRELVDKGALTIEQAIFAVHIWLWSGGAFDDVLINVGWLPANQRS
ncbi:hypothetical protein KF707_03900 [Candidatus Obscuribacterales bacterium]|nr:hypothetical protein [Candidatus Obscuribacterales bacterium]